MLILLQSLSPSSSTHSREDDVLPVDASRAVPHSSDALPTASSPDARPERDPNMAKSSQGIRMLKRLLPARTRKSNKDPVLHGPDRIPKESPPSTQHPSHSQPPGTVEATNEGPSWMAATKHVPVSILPRRRLCV